MKTKMHTASTSTTAIMNSILEKQSTKHITNLDAFYSVQVSKQHIFCCPINSDPYIFHKALPDGTPAQIERPESKSKTGTEKIRNQIHLQMKFERKARQSSPNAGGEG